MYIISVLFSWMKDVEGLTANTFSKVIGYTLPQYSQVYIETIPSIMYVLV